MSAAILFAVALSWFCAAVPARADDPYDSPFAAAVRTSTQRFRLAMWARADGYVQSTDTIPGVGVMYTDHDNFNPPDLAHPTVLIFNEADQLVACGYQFMAGSMPPADFAAVPPGAWYTIPRHLHYNITVGDKTYFAQAAWDDDAKPTAPELIKRGLMPPDGTLLFAFVHPATRALLVWAWLPNAAGLFAGENSLLP
ncbi:MAG TPA: hypothetical protein VKT51_02025 [Candidatus Eremiobacteraceae bacterium]|nr:hypothetical protein [Candidatus Eremiobacteraceae bacterium]